MFPKIVLDGDTEAARALIPLGHQVLYRARAQIQASGQSIAHAAVRLSADAYAEAVIIAGTEVIRVFATPRPRRSSIPTGISRSILSGLIRGGTISSGKLSVFRPTQECWESVLDRDPDVLPENFSAIERLAVRIHPDIAEPGHNGKSQYQRLKPTMYTGRMAKLVQLLGGYGRMPEDELVGVSDEETAREEGIQIRYDYRWARCHGISMSGGSPWLVEISITNGVLAMPLPMFEDAVEGDQDVLAEADRLFGGLPTGDTFPTGEALTQAIAAGRVHRLMTPEGMDEFFALSAFTSTCGWSFNDSGSEAHNTAYEEVGSDAYACHYRIDIQVGDAPSASLHLVSRERIVQPLLPVPWEALAMPGYFWEPLIEGWAEMPFSPEAVTEGDHPAAVLWVGHAPDGTFFRVMHKVDLTHTYWHGGWQKSPNCMEFRTDDHTGDVIGKPWSIGLNEVMTCPCIFFQSYIAAIPGPELGSRIVLDEGTLTKNVNVGILKNSIFYTFDSYVEQSAFFPEGYRDAFTFVTREPENARSGFAWSSPYTSQIGEDGHGAIIVTVVPSTLAFPPEQQDYLASIWAIADAQGYELQDEVYAAVIAAGGGGPGNLSVVYTQFSTAVNATETVVDDVIPPVLTTFSVPHDVVDITDEAYQLRGRGGNGCRHRVVGTTMGEPHHAVSKNLTADMVRSGPLFAGEPDPTNANYCFIGYSK